MIDANIKKGKTLTFYSYKGGVGRSMALVNIACLAARENKKVLLIDCDLEAPGLHQFFEVNESRLGFIDMVIDINKFTENEDDNNEEGYCTFMKENIENYIEKGVFPKQESSDITIDLIKAGKFDQQYSKKLNSINWLNLYEKSPAFFRTFAYCLEIEYDYIFIDSRTGLADTSGICTMLMPQKLVLVFALNNQNIDGIVDVARQAISYRLLSNDFRKLDVLPLPSRIENSINPNLEKWIDNYKKKFETLFKEIYLLDECDLNNYFDRSFIQYYPIHAYGENIPSLYESTSSGNFITYNYANFLSVIKKNISSWEVTSLEEEITNERISNEHLKVGLNFFYQKEYAKAINEYTKAIEFSPDSFEAYNNRGIAKNELKQYNEAIKDFNKAIEIKPDYEPAYSNRGNSNLALNRKEDALEDFSIAIKLDNSENPETKIEVIKNLSLGGYEKSQKYHLSNIKATVNKKKISLFIASAIDVIEEREKCILLINHLEKAHPHLDLDIVTWEDYTTSFNQSISTSIQETINTDLYESDLVIFIFYSKIGHYTRDEFNKALSLNKKIFALFKSGFSPSNKAEMNTYGTLLDFKESLNEIILYEHYSDENEFYNRLYRSLSIYLSETYPATEITLDNDYQQLPAELMLLIEALSEKENQIKRLEALLPKTGNDNEIQKLSEDIGNIKNQLAKSEELRQQLANDREVLQQQLTIQKDNDQLKAKALIALENRDYESAELLLKRSAKESITLTAKTFYDLANIKKIKLEYKEALEYFELALKIEPNNPIFFNASGEMALRMNYIEKAILYFEKSLALKNEFYVAGDPEIAISYNNLGKVYATKGEYEKAKDYYERAININKEFYGERHPSIAANYNNLGLINNSNGEYTKAINYYEQAIDINKEFYGERSLEIAECYDHMGLAYNNIGNFNTAIGYYQEALSIYIEFLGNEHPNIAIVFNNLGETYSNKGEYDMASVYFEKALRINKDFYGSEHANLSINYNNLGLVSNYKKEYDKAIEYFEKALILEKKRNDKNNPEMAVRYNNLALTYRSKGNYDKALVYYEEALDILTSLLPANHSNILSLQQDVSLVKKALK